MATSLPAGLGMQGAGGSPGHPSQGFSKLADVQWTRVKSLWLFNYENTSIPVGKLFPQAHRGLLLSRHPRPGTPGPSQNAETRGHMPLLSRDFLIVMQGFTPLGQSSGLALNLADLLARPPHAGVPLPGPASIFPLPPPCSLMHSASPVHTPLLRSRLTYPAAP